MACTNADIYYSIIHCYLTGDDMSEYMQEMERRGYTDIDTEIIANSFITANMPHIQNTYNHYANKLLYK